MRVDKKSILIVDDEEDLTWSLSKRLSRDKDVIEITCANSGVNALKILSQKQFDLMVTDLRMPGVSGIQLLNEVRSKHPATHVIVMTAYGSLEIKEALDHLGEAGYIQKPFEFDDLRNLIYTSLFDQKCA